MRKHNTICAGIDTGKRKLDVALAECPQRLQVANDPEGHTALSAWFRQHRVKRVGIEASGYEQTVVARLRRDGFGAARLAAILAGESPANRGVQSLL